jgi:hypothetical protein
MGSVGLETTNYCAREVQQQFNSQRSSGVRQWPAGNGVSVKAEQSPLLESVTCKRLVKTLQAGIHLACALLSVALFVRALK